MGGKMSRDKGARVERLLRDYLVKQGFESHRVPLSGAVKGYKGDVIAKNPVSGFEFLFEVKARKGTFDTLFLTLFEKCEGVRLTIKLPDGTFARVFTEFPAPENAAFYVPPLARTAKMLMGLRDLLGEAHILALKPNNKPFMFVMYEKTL